MAFNNEKLEELSKKESEAYHKLLDFPQNKLSPEDYNTFVKLASDYQQANHERIMELIK